jgi:MYXO-CTERM domain-containing protein
MRLTILFACASLLVVGRAVAASVTIQAGQTYSLGSTDLVLNGADTLDANGTPSNPCTITGNGRAIIGRSLTGHVKIENCILQGLGGTTENAPAVELTAQGSADITITGSTFDACGTIRLHVNGSATASFSNNLLKDNGIAYIQNELQGSMYVPAFYADGGSSATKVFQGNRLYRSAAHFQGVDNWLIGGYGDQFTNVIIGHRGVIRVDGNHVKVVGNFINPQYPLTSPDVENLVVGSNDDNPDLVVEHNVLRSGEWVMRECMGEVRYNVIADMNGHAWIKGPHSCNIHHNIFVNYANPDHNSEGGIDIVYLVTNLNIYNNTFDGGGRIGNLNVPAIHAKQGRVIERVHSNAFTNFAISNSSYAIVSALGPDMFDTDPPPGDTRLHYADYNLFHNPDAPGSQDYSIKCEPTDAPPALAVGAAGCGKNDLHADPGFRGPLPAAFPHDNAGIMNGTITVSMMLASYRDLYTPTAGSPLTGAGDPMGGANNNIGAVGQGSASDPNDQIGTFQPGSGGGPPPLTGAGGTTGGPGSAGTTGSPGTAGNTGIAGANTGGCSCAVQQLPPGGSAGLLAVLAVALGALLSRRRASRP